MIAGGHSHSELEKSPLPGLACKGVRFGYGGRTVLSNVSLTVREGALIGVIGPNGAGKSTLIRLLSGMLSPDRGSVTLDGTPMRLLRRRFIAKEISVLAQDEAADFPFTVQEMVSMGRAPYHGGLYFENKGDVAVIEQSMERAGVAHLADRPFGELSGGERQRVRIARSLAQKPRFLLLDEPTNHLDLHSRLSVMELLREIHGEGLAIVLVSHDINLVSELCESVRLFRNGTFMLEGTPEEVITEDNVALCFNIRALVDVNPVTGAPRVTPLEMLDSNHL